ncbi:chemokine-like protein TAFA-5a [Garra rufa]|uniref:chemokine-like protein TAFA-5a n=1 Tax=Garra rufa TaxID=137080 RepID=UPI003CCE702F
MLKAVRMLMLRVAWALAGAAICCFLIILIHSRFLREGQLAAGTCEIVTLDRDSSQPRRTIARQTARCACKKGQIAGTTRARPACVDGKIKFGETVNQKYQPFLSYL